MVPGSPIKSSVKSSLSKANWLQLRLSSQQTMPRLRHGGDLVLSGGLLHHHILSPATACHLSVLPLAFMRLWMAPWSTSKGDNLHSGCFPRTLEAVQPLGTSLRVSEQQSGSLAPKKLLEFSQ